MEIYRVSFIGHRKIYCIDEIEANIERILRDLLYQKEYVEFYVGRNGDFDILAASAIKRVQKDFWKNCSLILVLPYHVKDEQYYNHFYDEICLPVDPKTHFKAAIIKRNEWLIDCSNLLITYVEHKSGGAYKTLEYAKQKGVKIINIAK
ncbi:MAG: hypothetical protein IJW92_02415 [Clostridia bacterium]|nr:hypothetical protein [Clostridia bacterium]